MVRALACFSNVLPFIIPAYPSIGHHGDCFTLKGSAVQNTTENWIRTGRQASPRTALPGRSTCTVRLGLTRPWIWTRFMR
ncbi:hypothetical protein JTE90_000082 [Oedothorax gibbosus]|uniref:Secreted protein n=1 Tax=Oedothorax gibbosus TaxID=931172 RepID=A0AAV6UE40_9ARAC|nr:hypothetical protein JTE90_000082 [Oedothorax gibbosus]